MCAKGELLHFLTGTAPLDPGRKGRVLSSESGNRCHCDMLGPSVVDDGVNFLSGVLLHRLHSSSDRIAGRDKDLNGQAALYLFIFICLMFELSVSCFSTLCKTDRLALY